MVERAGETLQASLELLLHRRSILFVAHVVRSLCCSEAKHRVGLEGNGSILSQQTEVPGFYLREASGGLGRLLALSEVVLQNRPPAERILSG